MLNGINLIRALSCLAIALFHICELINATYTGVQVSFNLAGPGFHLFLMISGFILVYITHPEDNPARFITKRIIRIAPAYWLMTTLAIGLTLLRPWFLPGADLSPESIIKSYAFLPHVDQVGRTMPILFVGWTLGYMMLFYGLFSLSLLVPARFQIWTAIGGLLAVMALAQFLPDPVWQAFYGDPILLEFAAGCLVGKALRNPGVIEWIKGHQMWPIALVGFIGLIVAMLSNTQGFTQVALYAPASALLVFAAVGQDLYRVRLGGGVLQRLGLVSYGVFLIHPLVIPVFGVVIHDYIDDGPIGAVLLFASVLPVTLLLADLCYRFVEKPSNDWLRAKLIRRPKRVTKAPVPGVGGA